MQYSVTLRNNQLDQIATTSGASSILRFLSGTAPASCADAQTGTLLAEIALPVTWMAAAADGSVSKTGTWEDLSANADGTLGYFRLYDNTGTVCHIQGTITLTAGGGDMTVDNTSVLTSQTITVTSFGVSAGNA